MKAFWLGLLHVAIGGALVPVLNAVASGHLSPTGILMGAAAGAATNALAYFQTAPKDQKPTS